MIDHPQELAEFLLEYATPSDPKVLEEFSMTELLLFVFFLIVRARLDR
jgi:hypothetical protein